MRRAGNYSALAAGHRGRGGTGWLLCSPQSPWAGGAASARAAAGCRDVCGVQVPVYRVHRCLGSKVHGFRGSGVAGGVCGCTGTGVPEYMGARTHGHVGRVYMGMQGA